MQIYATVCESRRFDSSPACFLPPLLAAAAEFCIFLQRASNKMHRTNLFALRCCQHRTVEKSEDTKRRRRKNFMRSAQSCVLLSRILRFLYITGTLRLWGGRAASTATKITLAHQESVFMRVGRAGSGRRTLLNFLPFSLLTLCIRGISYLAIDPFILRSTS